ncbi:MAG: mechanosensitive ion channel family protein [Candidatus Aenigmarchaeota archaeon]|nr:mechanosensitive ion channel family protein [Candidatus Aenigmarchaeota archaeon]
MVSLNFPVQNEYLQALLILLTAAVLAYILQFILKNYAKRLAEKTKTDIDDIILETATMPVYFLILFAGLYFSVKSLSAHIPYAALIDGIFFIAMALVAAFLVSKGLGAVISRWLHVRKRYEKTPRLISKMAAAAVYLIAFLIVLSHFDIEITPMIAALGLGGLAVGLALKDTLSNFFAGLHLISDRPINLGDFIEMEGGISGHVEDIGWRSTRMRTLQNNIVIVPNSRLAESIITNYSMQEPETAAVVQCGVAYDSDLKKVEEITAEVALKVQKTVQGAVKSFRPQVRFHAFGDSNILFSVGLRAEKYEDKGLLIHEFMKALKKRYDREGIEISWPVRKIYQAK